MTAETKKLPRRGFLGLTTGAVAAACARSPSQPRAASPTVTSAASTWESVREQFSLSRDHVHLAGFLLASHPKRVRDAIEHFRKALDDNPALTIEREIGGCEHGTRVRAAAAAYLGGAPDEIALTGSTTMGLATLYSGLSLRPGDEILTTTHDHYSTHESLRLVASRTGAIVRKVKLYDDPSSATEAQMTSALASAITERTRVVAITWVHSSTGVKIPVRRIADAIGASSRAGKGRIFLCVDGVHGFGVENVVMADLGCDFFVAGCHKWLFGPRGTGILWGRASSLPALTPTIPPFFAGDYLLARSYGGEVPPTNGWVMSPGGFHAYEHQWALGEAFEMHREIGKASVEKRIHELNRHAKDGLASMRHVTLHTPRADAVSAGIVCFEVAGMKPEAVVNRLLVDHKVIASVTPYRPPLVRISAGLMNTHEDVDAGLRAVRSLA